MTKSKLIKTISLGVASAAFALIFALFFKSFLSLGGLTALIFLVLATVLFLAVFLIQTLLLDGFSTNAAIVLADCVLIALIFIGNFSFLILVSILAMGGLLLTGYHAARLELKNNLDIRFFKTSGYVLKYASSALAIFAVTTYIALLNLEDPQAAKAALEAIIKPVEPITAAYIPGFKITDPLTEISRKIMPAEVQSASPAKQSDFIKASSDRLADAIGGFVKTIISTKDSIVDVTYKATIAKLLKLTPFMRNLILAGAGLVSFFTLKFLLIFIDWLAILVGFGIYNLLWGAEFFKVELQSKTQKVIVLHD